MCDCLDIGRSDDWAAFSDEYVIVDNEYEDVGRKVLDGHNLNVELEEKLHEKKPKAAPAPVDVPVAPAPLMPPAPSLAATTAPTECAEHNHRSTVDTPSERTDTAAAPSAFESKPRVPPAAAPVESIADTDAAWLAGERKEWVTDDNRLEELLGICYKSFSCGSVGLFVPTPFGDYIAFHEGCPHYYLSMESIAACKRDGRCVASRLGQSSTMMIDDHHSLSHILATTLYDAAIRRTCSVASSLSKTTSRPRYVKDASLVASRCMYSRLTDGLTLAYVSRTRIRSACAKARSTTS